MMSLQTKPSTVFAMALASAVLAAAGLLWFTAVRPRSTNAVHWVRCAACDATMISEPHSVPYVCGSCGAPLLFRDKP